MSFFHKKFLLITFGAQSHAWITKLISYKSNWDKNHAEVIQYNVKKIGSASPFHWLHIRNSRAIRCNSKMWPI